jgi:hypothetical protein
LGGKYNAQNIPDFLLSRTVVHHEYHVQDKNQEAGILLALLIINEAQFVDRNINVVGKVHFLYSKAKIKFHELDDIPQFLSFSDRLIHLILEQQEID